MTEAEWKERLQDELGAYAVGVEEEGWARLAGYLARLTEWNRRVRLVGSTEPVELIRRHTGESLYLSRVFPLTSQSLADIGSGAGFPGLVLQLAFPGLSVALVESKAKKAAFLSEVCRTYGLGRVVHQRAEELELGVEVVTSRALERMEENLKVLQQQARRGGWLALWVSEGLAERWSKASQWTEFHWKRLPGATERGIFLAR